MATRGCFEESEQCILGWKRVERVNKGTTLHLRLDFSHLWCIQDQARRNSLGIDKHGFFEETKNSTTSFSSWLQERAVSPITLLDAKGWYRYHSLICRCRELLFLPSCICISPMENTNRFSTFSLCSSLSLPGVAQPLGWWAVVLTRSRSHCQPWPCSHQHEGLAGPSAPAPLTTRARFTQRLYVRYSRPLFS